MGVLDEIREAVAAGEPVESLVREALQGSSAYEILSEAVIPGVDWAGELWQRGEYFLPDIVLATDSFQEAMTILEPLLAERELNRHGKYLIGVVEGDMHDLGKSIVVSMLTCGGFEVIDLGANVPIRTFVEKVREHEPDILGIGAYMSTTMLLIKDVIDTLSAEGLRDRVKVMVGGVPVTPKYARDVGADGFGMDAMEALEVARKLVK